MTDTDFGALKVTSIPPPRPPPAPTRTDPLAGGGVAALHQREEVIAVHDRAGGDPQALLVSGSASHRPAGSRHLAHLG